MASISCSASRRTPLNADPLGSTGAGTTRGLARYSPALGRQAVKFRVLIDQDEDGVFVAQVPALPGCITQGATRQEAVANAEEAIAGYLESLNERGEAIPPAINEELVEVAV